MAFASVTMCLYMTFLALTLRFGAERQNHDASTPGTQGPLAKLYARAIESVLANSLRNNILQISARLKESPKIARGVCLQLSLLPAAVEEHSVVMRLSVQFVHVTTEPEDDADHNAH